MTVLMKKVGVHMKQGLSPLAVLAFTALLISGCFADKSGQYKPSKKARDLNNQAVAALNQQDNERALMLIGEAISIEPEFYGAYGNKAAILKAMGREPEAIETLKAAIQVKPEYVEAYVPLALMLERNAKADEAKALYAQAITLYDARLAKAPDSPDMAVNRAVAVYLGGNAQEALLALKEVLAKHPEHEQASVIKRRIEKGTRESFVAGISPGATEAQK